MTVVVGGGQLVKASGGSFRIERFVVSNRSVGNYHLIEMGYYAKPSKRDIERSAKVAPSWRYLLFRLIDLP